MNEFIPQGLLRHSGVVLRRTSSPEGNLSLYLLLRTVGPQWVSAPGASRGRMRFGGSVEPLVWGNFNLYKGTKRLYLKSVDVSEDFWVLRKDPERLRMLLEWDRLLSLHLVPDHPCDDVLAIFYWSSILVRHGVHPLLAEWRFLWRWLNAWGVAPSLDRCVTCGRQLAEGYWTATGLQCGRCGRGPSVPAEVLRRLRVAAAASTRELKNGGAAAFDGEELWRDACQRLRMFLEYVR